MIYFLQITLCASSGSLFRQITALLGNLPGPSLSLCSQSPFSPSSLLCGCKADWKRLFLWRETRVSGVGPHQLIRKLLQCLELHKAPTQPMSTLHSNSVPLCPSSFLLMILSVGPYTAFLCCMTCSLSFRVISTLNNSFYIRTKYSSFFHQCKNFKNLFCFHGDCIS